VVGDAVSPAARDAASGGAGPVLVARGLTKWFRSRSELVGLLSGRPGPVVRAVDDVSFEIREGEILGLVGESGSGKTTLGRLLLRLETPDGGEIRLRDGRDIAALRGRDLRRFYRDVQMVFQDPYESINPRFTVFDTVVEPLRAQGIGRGAERGARVAAALDRAGLRPPESFLAKYPHELSGGERQRLAIARALVLEPRVLVADEPVSMLDVSIRAGILNLLRRLARELGLTILYISHDLSTTRYLCDRIVIMYRGVFVEIGDPEQVIGAPRHPYAQALASSIPVPDPTVIRTRADPDHEPGEGEPDPGACRYVALCPDAMSVCRREPPRLREVAAGHRVACYLYEKGESA
jgi:peptide/nickel transport system ATP-binding protein